MLEFEQHLAKPITRLVNPKYNGIIDLSKKKGRFPSTKRRFCTEKLKVEPTIDYILDVVKESCTIYQGIRWEESKNRAAANMIDDYFKGYTTPTITICAKTGKEKKKYHSYRRKEVLKFLKEHECIVKRPIISWTGVQVIKYITQQGFNYNPLYDMGFSRVGCFPCIMCNHSEMALIIQHFPERITEIASYEKEIGSTFFPPDFIPPRYCSKKVVDKKGKESYVPTIEDVVRYLKDRHLKQSNMFPTPSECKNIYNPCE